MSFDSLGLRAELLRAVLDQGYTTPTPVQAQAIPAVLGGRDLMAAAQTGTGKTAGFTLPILQRLMQEPRPGGKPVRVLILTPTRELCAQVADSVATYGKYLPIRSTMVFGGVGFSPQVDNLRRGPEIVIATPGRLLDHVPLLAGLDTSYMLRDLGVPYDAFADTVRCVWSQFLVEALCPQCAAEAILSPEEVERLFPAGPPHRPIRTEVGCAACGGRGTNGRVAISAGTSL